MSTLNLHKLSDISNYSTISTFELITKYYNQEITTDNIDQIISELLFNIELNSSEKLYKTYNRKFYEDNFPNNSHTYFQIDFIVFDEENNNWTIENVIEFEYIDPDNISEGFDIHFFTYDY
jgi:hypothetical protein